MVVRDVISRPYTRVAQPFGRAANALRLHSRTLFRSLPPACINSAAGGAREQAQPPPSPAALLGFWGY
jgi:hypothetical protein